MKPKIAAILLVLVVSLSAGFLYFVFQDETVKTCYIVVNKNTLLRNGVSQLFYRNDTYNGSVEFRFDILSNDTLKTDYDVLIITYSRSVLKPVRIEVKSDAISYMILNQTTCPAFADGLYEKNLNVS